VSPKSFFIHSTIFGGSMSGVRHFCLLGVAFSVLAWGVAAPAAASSFSLIHNFTGSDGQQPSGALVADSSGRLYGTTFAGGAHGTGSVFRLTKVGKAWNEEVLYSFPGTSGVRGGVLIGPSGELYGTTVFGGAFSSGTVWRLDPSGSTWTLTTLHTFNPAGGKDGYYPNAGLVFGKDGLLYGTTMGQQPQDGEQPKQSPMYGTVFSVSPNGDAAEYALLHVFGGTNDGQFPGFGKLLVDNKGVLTGTTELGGKLSDGTAFRLTPPKKSGKPWSETVLHDFGATGDAVGPSTGLVRGLNGAFYGCAAWGKNGFGAVYSLTPDGEQVLYNFGDQAGDPSAASSCAVTVDATGTLYGTAPSGGANSKGAVFKVTPPAAGQTGWTETVLHSFTGSDGQNPTSAPLKRGKVLYGVADLGGGGGKGTVYSATSQ
jgi:uncharacterized repeat protein (TIGR03803 family)